jgi:hypothetical protein
MECARILYFTRIRGSLQTSRFPASVLISNQDASRGTRRQEWLCHKEELASPPLQWRAQHALGSGPL